jgi:peptidyl-prolyl cis-trans isomerase C
MRLARVVCGLSLGLAWTAACASEHASSTVQTDKLAEGVAARVGDDVVLLETVRRVAVAQGSSAREARDRLITDTLLAAEARRRFVGSGLAGTAERVALSRAVLEQLTEKARAQGPPSQAETLELTRERWWELDRPSSSRTTHAVVIVDRPEREAEARDVADEIAEAVRDVRAAELFLERAHAVAARGLRVRVERLPPVTSDGRIVPEAGSVNRDRGGRFDEQFARAANAIAGVGEQSPVTRTRFGFHIILLEERLPEQRPSLEERTRLLADEVTARRARQLADSLLERLRAQTPVEISRSADELTGRLDIGRQQ